MKSIISALALVLLLTLSSCVSCPPCPVSPPEDIIIMTPWGPLSIDKGTLIPDNYYTIPEWQELVKAYENSVDKSGGL